MIYVSFKSNLVGLNLGIAKDSKAKKNLYSNIRTKKPMGTFCVECNNEDCKVFCFED
jgi:hypothetical protein